MKSKLFAKKALIIVALALLFVGCKGGGKKDKGAGKDDVTKLLEAYSQENSILNGEVTKKEKEIEMLKAELAGLQQQSNVDNDVINKLKGLVGEGEPGEWKVEQGGVALDSDVTFASGSENLSSKGLANIKKLMDTGWLKEGTIYVVGHTDTDPISKTKNKHSSNFELSAKRAAHVAEQLIALGIHGERIVVQAHGEFKPLAGKSKRDQRRIVFRVAK